MIYGGSEYSYARDPDFVEVSRDKNFWKEVIEKFYDKYRGIAAVHQAWMNQVQVHQRLVMPTGREYAFTLTDRGEWPRTQILNYPVQGLGADLMAIIRILARRYLDEKYKIVSTVHDSIYTEVAPEDPPEAVREAYQRAFAEAPEAFRKAFGYQFNLPLRCEITIGRNMHDMEPF